jgi:hypothetical protein
VAAAGVSISPRMGVSLRRHRCGGQVAFRSSRHQARARLRSRTKPASLLPRTNVSPRQTVAQQQKSLSHGAFCNSLGRAAAAGGDIRLIYPAGQLRNCSPCAEGKSAGADNAARPAQGEFDGYGL